MKNIVLAIKKVLTRKMDELGFSEHLVWGKEDIQNQINEEDSVKG